MSATGHCKFTTALITLFSWPSAHHDIVIMLLLILNRTQSFNSCPRSNSILMAMKTSYMILFLVHSLFLKQLETVWVWPFIDWLLIINLLSNWGQHERLLKHHGLMMQSFLSNFYRLCRTWSQYLTWWHAHARCWRLRTQLAAIIIEQVHFTLPEIFLIFNPS